MNNAFDSMAWNGRPMRFTVEPADDVKWKIIKRNRNLYLSACDWTQLPDAVLTLAEKSTWQDYRQALRDIPQNYVSPDDVIFPEVPA